MAERWTLTKSFTFEASHQLPDHNGKCARLHGHSWRLTVGLSGDQLQETGSERGMLVDYYHIGLVVKALIEKHLDHYHLNDLLPNPTSENLSRWAFHRIREELGSRGELLEFVEIGETCTTGCKYNG